MFRKLRIRILVFTAFGTALAAPFAAQAGNLTGNALSDLEVDDVSQVELPKTVGSAVIRRLEIHEYGKQIPIADETGFNTRSNTPFDEIQDPFARRCAAQAYLALHSAIQDYQPINPIHDLRFDLIVDRVQKNSKQKGQILDQRGLTALSSGHIEGAVRINIPWKNENGILVCNAPTRREIRTFLHGLEFASRDPRASDLFFGRAPAGISDLPIYADEAKSSAAVAN